MRACYGVIVGMVAGLAASCSAREAKEACEEYYDRLLMCPNVDVDLPSCDDVKASEQDKYECLAGLEDVCVKSDEC